MAALAARQADQNIEVWPENWAVFEIFCQLRTQWNGVMGGRTGLRYEAAYPLLDRKAQSQDEWGELFDDLQAMEYAALEQMSEGD